MTHAMTTMPKYESYKDSGSKWMGQVPADWEVTSLGPLLKPISEKNQPDLPLLSITREQGVIIRDVEDQESNHNFIPDDLSGYKVIRKGQFGMNKMKAWQGSYGVSDHTGIVSPAYFIFDFTKPIVPEYFHWAIRSRLYVSYFASASDGVRIGQWDLSKPRMKVIPFLVPSVEEQEAIARFLDEKTVQIDEAIGIKEQQIALLKERKQIIIQNAVTKGLTPNAPMKDSGVDWIGDIPSHWETVPNKRLFSIRKEIVGKKSSDFDLLSLTLKGIIKRDMDNPEGKFPAEFDTYQIVYKNDFVFCLFDVEETPRTVGLSEHYGMITGAYTVMRITESVNPEYIEQLYIVMDQQKKFKSLYKGLRNTIPKDVFGCIKTPIPPKHEQDEIIRFIESQSRQVDAGISAQQAQIDKLKEYKASLINSAVTGKIKVI